MNERDSQKFKATPSKESPEESFEQSYDAIVLGLGAMGTAAAHHLAQRGLKVLGLEQFSIGHSKGSSRGDTRIIRKAYFEDPSYVPLLVRSYQLWEKLEEQAGEKLLVRNGMVIYGGPEKSVIFRGTLDSAKHHHLPIEELDHKAARSRFPHYCPSAKQCAVFEKDAGFVLAEASVLAQAKMARQFGATLLEGVRGVSFRIEGSGVRVEIGDRHVHASRLIIAGGSWSQKILSDLKLPLHLKRMILFWLLTKDQHRQAKDLPCFGFDTGSEFYYGFPPHDGKTVKLATHYQGETILDPSEKEIDTLPEGQKQNLFEFINRALPGVTPEVARWSSCLYTMTPDENFIIDHHPMHPQICFAAGFSGHGFKFAPVVGEILAELAIDSRTKHPIEFLRASRFHQALSS